MAKQNYLKVKQSLSGIFHLSFNKGQVVKIGDNKDVTDAQLKQAQLLIDKSRVDNQAKIEGVRIGAKYKFDEKKLDADQTAAGVRIGADISKQEKQLKAQMMQAYQNRQHQTAQAGKQKANKPTKGE